ncbi:polyketide synthase module [Burkholderia thailandensis H0587]|nr:polyketide synthase module [Burkholderia thailandensis H0587]
MRARGARARRPRRGARPSRRDLGRVGHRRLSGRPCARPARSRVAEPLPAAMGGRRQGLSRDAGGVPAGLRRACGHAADRLFDVARRGGPCAAWAAEFPVRLRGGGRRQHRAAAAARACVRGGQHPVRRRRVPAIHDGKQWHRLRQRRGGRGPAAPGGCARRRRPDSGGDSRRRDQQRRGGEGRLHRAGRPGAARGDPSRAGVERSRRRVDRLCRDARHGHGDRRRGRTGGADRGAGRSTARRCAVRAWIAQGERRASERGRGSVRPDQGLAGGGARAASGGGGRRTGDRDAARRIRVLPADEHGAVGRAAPACGRQLVRHRRHQCARDRGGRAAVRPQDAANGAAAVAVGARHGAARAVRELCDVSRRQPGPAARGRVLDGGHRPPSLGAARGVSRRIPRAVDRFAAGIRRGRFRCRRDQRRSAGPRAGSELRVWRRTRSRRGPRPRAGVRRRAGERVRDGRRRVRGGLRRRRAESRRRTEPSRGQRRRAGAAVDQRIVGLAHRQPGGGARRTGARERRRARCHGGAGGRGCRAGAGVRRRGIGRGGRGRGVARSRVAGGDRPHVDGRRGARPDAALSRRQPGRAADLSVPAPALLDRARATLGRTRRVAVPRAANRRARAECDALRRRLERGDAAVSPGSRHLRKDRRVGRGPRRDDRRRRAGAHRGGCLRVERPALSGGTGDSGGRGAAGATATGARRRRFRGGRAHARALRNPCDGTRRSGRGSRRRAIGAGARRSDLHRLAGYVAARSQRRHGADVPPALGDRRERQRGCLRDARRSRRRGLAAAPRHSRLGAATGRGRRAARWKRRVRADSHRTVDDPRARRRADALLCGRRPRLRERVRR